MKIAIFSDLHGRIALAFKLVERYQRETGNKIDLILQCGDIGAFPDLDSLDKATIRHAQHDRSELGFHDQFVQPDATLVKLFEKLDCDMVCVRGNHEDHVFLDQLEAKYPNECIFPIDCYNKMYVIKSGHIFDFSTNEQNIRILGIGRVGDRKGRTHDKFIQEYEQKQLKKVLKSKQSIDILFSHDVPQDMTDPGYGMEELRPVLDGLIPEYHFYGHTGKPYLERLDLNGITKSVKVAELEYNRNSILDFGSMLILEKSEEGKLSTSVVYDDWYKSYTKNEWMYIS